MHYTGFTVQTHATISYHIAIQILMNLMACKLIASENENESDKKRPEFGVPVFPFMAKQRDMPTVLLTVVRDIS